MADLDAGGTWAERAYSTAPTEEDRGRDEAFLALDSPQMMDWMDGSRIYLIPGEDLSRAIARTGTYEPETISFLRRVIKRGSVFVDVGANSGVFTVAASRWVGSAGQVIAVEPSKRERAKLDRNITASAATNVYVWPFALGAATSLGGLSLGDHAHAGLNTLGPRIPWGIQTYDVAPVMVCALDDVARLEQLHVMKVDVEGAEADFLRGAARTIARHRPILVLELGHSTMEAYGSSATDLAGALVSLGYNLNAIQPDGSLRRLASLGNAKEGNIVALPG